MTAEHETVLVTGVAGFIGSHVAERLLSAGRVVVGLDNLNSYYDPKLKLARLARLESLPSFTFLKCDLTDRDAVATLFQRYAPQRVIHLAAQAGVRYSLEAPFAYTDSNIRGFLTVLEGCRATGCAHLVYASTSSVYGLATRMPFSEHLPADHPMTLYAATKRANELMAHSYAHLFGVPATGLRFFTVYGPWGRPDMALFKFTRAIIAGQPIQLFNGGNMARDFTYIDDIADAILRVAERPPQENPAWDAMRMDPATSSAPWRMLNIGSNRPVQLIDYVRALEKALGKKAQIEFLPMQSGDVPATHADVSELEALTDFRPVIPVETGVGRFVAWYREFYAE